MKATARYGVLVCCLILHSCAQPEPDLVIRDINIVDVRTGEILPEASVAIGAGTIMKINTGGTTIQIPEGVQIIEGKGNFLMPGLVDAHIHLSHTGGLYSRPDILDMRDTVPYREEMALTEALLSDHLRRYLRSGITSIMDMGGTMKSLDLLDSLQGPVPRVLVSGPQLVFYQPPQMSQEDAPFRFVGNARKAREEFEEVVGRAPDYLSVWFPNSSAIPATTAYPIVKSLAESAHDRGLKLFVQANDFEAARLAVEAGADALIQSVESQEITSDFVELLSKTNTSYISTLTVTENYYRVFTSRPAELNSDSYGANPMVYGTLFQLAAYPDYTLPRHIQDMRKRTASFEKLSESRRKIIGKNLYKLSQAGINVITGSDAGNIGTLHVSSYFREWDAMFDAGLSHYGILKASTINAARAFGLEAEIGSVEKGKRADLLILSRNPLENYRHMTEIELVIKDGEMFDPDTLVSETPEMIVQRQLNAYNARNLEAFLDTYADDVKIYNRPDELIMNGKEEMRARYGRLFESTPNLYCEIKKREVEGNLVTDTEYVRVGEQYINARAIYEVLDGRIAKVTFDR